jgi:hypothetical protein
MGGASAGGLLLRPHSHFQIPSKLLPRAIRDDGMPADDPKYPVINQLNTIIQGLLDTSSNMRQEQYVRSLMEAAVLTGYDHPSLARLREFATDRRQPLHSV